MATVQILEYGRPRDGVAVLARAVDVTSSGTAGSHSVGLGVGAIKIKALDGNIRVRLDGTASDASGSVYIASGDSEAFELERTVSYTVSYIDAA